MDNRFQSFGGGQTPLFLLSDLHLEGSDYAPPSIKEGIVILAGDIASHMNPVVWARANFNVPVIFVPGNHDYYGKNMQEAEEEWRLAAEGTHVHVLINDTCEIYGLRFAGTPLWSGLSWGETPSPQYCDAVQGMIRDFAVTECNGEMFSVEDHIRLYEESLSFLEKELDGETITVTHFAPHKNSVAPFFEAHPLNLYFVNHLPHLVAKTPLWLHGHTHTRMHYKVDKTSVFCHPRGYVSGVEQEIKGPFGPLLIDNFL